MFRDKNAATFNWAICCLALVIPFLSANYVPMVDMPQHLNQIMLFLRENGASNSLYIILEGLYPVGSVKATVLVHADQRACRRERKDGGSNLKSSHEFCLLVLGLIEERDSGCQVSDIGPH